MARVHYGALVTEIHGSIGGTTFQSNAHGFTIKNKPNQPFPNKAKQNFVKKYVTKCSQKWQALLVSQQNSWNSYAITYPQYAKHNPSSKLSGFEVFLKRNLNAYIQNAFILDDVMIQPTVSCVFTPVLHENGGVTTLDYNASPPPLDLDVWIWSSPPLNSLRYIPKNSLRFLRGDSMGAGSVVLDDAYEEVYGVVPVNGQYVMLKIQAIGDLTGAVFTPQFNIVQVVP